jgi:hypothetical protein
MKKDIEKIMEELAKGSDRMIVEWGLRLTLVVN